MIEILEVKEVKEPWVESLKTLRSLIQKEHRRQAFVKKLGNEIVSEEDREEFRTDYNAWIIRQDLAQALARGRRPLCAYQGETILK